MDPKPLTVSIAQLLEQRAKWATPGTKECPGSVQTSAGSFPCGQLLPQDAEECPVCRFSFSERH